MAMLGLIETVDCDKVVIRWLLTTELKVGFVSSVCTEESSSQESVENSLDVAHEALANLLFS